MANGELQDSPNQTNKNIPHNVVDHSTEPTQVKWTG